MSGLYRNAFPSPPLSTPTQCYNGLLLLPAPQLEPIKDTQRGPRDYEGELKTHAVETEMTNDSYPMLKEKLKTECDALEPQTPVYLSAQYQKSPWETNSKENPWQEPSTSASVISNQEGCETEESGSNFKRDNAVMISLLESINHYECSSTKQGTALEAPADMKVETGTKEIENHHDRVTSTELKYDAYKSNSVRVQDATKESLKVEEETGIEPKSVIGELAWMRYLSEEESVRSDARCVCQNNSVENMAPVDLSDSADWDLYSEEQFGSALKALKQESYEEDMYESHKNNMQEHEELQRAYQIAELQTSFNSISLKSIRDFHVGKSFCCHRRNFCSVMVSLSKRFRHFALLQRPFVMLSKTDQRLLLSHNGPRYIQLILGTYHNAPNAQAQMAALFGTHCAGGAEESTSLKKISLQELNDVTKMFEEVSEIFVLRSLYNEIGTIPTVIHPYLALTILYNYGPQLEIMLEDAKQIFKLSRDARHMLFSFGTVTQVFFALLYCKAKDSFITQDRKEHFFGVKDEATFSTGHRSLT